MNNPKQGKVSRDFIRELMNIKVDYLDAVERKNTSNTIAGVILEETNKLSMLKKRL